MFRSLRRPHTRPEVAKALEYMGCGYLRREDYGNAYEAYEAAAVKYCKSGEAWIVERCKDEDLEGVREESDVVMGFRRSHLVSKGRYHRPCSSVCR